MSLETHPPAATPGTLVSSLPATPYDGQEVLYLASDTAGVVWRLRYRAASTSTYKWEVLGGAPLRGADLGNAVDPGLGESTTSTTGADLATPGPDVTVPLAGEYLVAIGATVLLNASPANAQMAVKNGAAALDMSDGWLWYPPAANTYASLSRTRQFTCAAGALLRCKYSVNTGTITAYFSRRWLNVLPLRVG